RCLSDWSSDVCSSDLAPRPADRAPLLRPVPALVQEPEPGLGVREGRGPQAAARNGSRYGTIDAEFAARDGAQEVLSSLPARRGRSEERRVGKGVGLGW